MVPIRLALVSCTHNISLDYLFFQIRKIKSKSRICADSRKVASPFAEWSLLMPAQGNKGVVLEMCLRWGTCTYLKCPRAELGMWPQRGRPQISLTSSSPISVPRAFVQTVLDWALCLLEWEDDKWDSCIKLTKHVNMLLTENRLVIVTLFPPSILVNTFQGFCYYTWTWFWEGYSFTGQRQKGVSMSTYLFSIHQENKASYAFT